ncbi:MAG: hypothetical protein HKN49_06160 [Gammaproteobacteria bacterium]|nr:hypothetical protein [Gammaproteobacteria bacterium]
MVSLFSLWLPVVLSAVACWIAGAIIWMVLPHHKNDFGRVPDEDATRNALQGIAPGQYTIPHIADPAKVSDADKAKFDQGPVAYVTAVENGFPAMGKKLLLQMLFLLIVSDIVAYVAAYSLPAGAGYLQVFQIVGTVAWLAYGFASLQDSIWFGKPWSFTFKGLFDALIYALLTAGIFGWLWPAAS